MLDGHWRLAEGSACQGPALSFDLASEQRLRRKKDERRLHWIGQKYSLSGWAISVSIHSVKRRESPFRLPCKVSSKCLVLYVGHFIVSLYTLKHRYYFYAHFQDGGAEAQRGKATCLKPHSKEWSQLG